MYIIGTAEQGRPVSVHGREICNRLHYPRDQILRACLKGADVHHRDCWAGGPVSIHGREICNSCSG